MADPISVGVIGAVALTEGIKFLYGQATELLARVRARKDAERSPADEPVLRPPAHLLDGAVEPTAPDYARLEQLLPELKELRRSLADYVDGLEDVDPKDPLLCDQVDALRNILEVVHGQRITFRGEEREPSGPLAEGRLTIDTIRGHAAAVRVRVLERGTVRGVVDAENLEAGATVFGVEIDEMK